jgi:16S rRNA processing protein RimM
MLLTLKEIPDRTAAEKLRGFEVLAEEAEFDSKIAESQQLIGREVFAQDKNMGTVKDIEHTACHEVLVVKAKNGKEVLIPYVDKFIKDVNNNSIIVDMTDLSEDNEI